MAGGYARRRGGAQAVRVGLKGGKQRGWLRPGWGQTGLVPHSLLKAVAPPDTSKVHPLLHHVLTFFSWLDVSSPTSRLSGSFLQGLLPNHSPAAKPEFFLLFLSHSAACLLHSSFLAGAHPSEFILLCLPLPQTSLPSCPYLSPPVLFSLRKRSWAHSHLSPPPSPFPCDFPFGYPRAPSPDSRFPQGQLIPSADWLWAVVTRATARAA